MGGYGGQDRTTISPRVYDPNFDKVQKENVVVSEIMEDQGDGIYFGKSQNPGNLSRREAFNNRAGGEVKVRSTAQP